METTLQPKPYLQDRDEHWEAYRKDNPAISEFMERDYKDGFSDGYNAAMNNVALRKRDEALRKRAAIAVMQGMLAHGTATCSREFLAKKRVALANALIDQLNTEQS